MTSARHTPVEGQCANLVVTGRVEDGGAVLTPRGELVHGCADILARALDDLPHRVGGVDLDMSGVVFMDTAGLAFLDLLEAYGRRHRVPVRATHWQGQPRRTLELAGLDTDDPLHRAAGTARTAGTVGTGPEPASPAASPVALERAEQLDLLREEVGQLRQALASRPVIDQARGVLMATHACSSQEAWDILREASQLSNTKLRAVAAAVTAGAGTNGPAPSQELRSALRRAISHRLG